VRRIAIILVLSLVVAMGTSAQAYASASDGAEAAADNAVSFSDTFWCTLGYSEYCP
jgi:hypothetical protein